MMAGLLDLSELAHSDVGRQPANRSTPPKRLSIVVEQVERIVTVDAVSCFVTLASGRKLGIKAAASTVVTGLGSPDVESTETSIQVTDVDTSETVDVIASKIEYLQPRAGFESSQTELGFVSGRTLIANSSLAALKTALAP